MAAAGGSWVEEDITRGPGALRRPGEDQRFNQYGGLDGHVNTAKNLRAFERLFGVCTCCASPSARAFRFGDDDFHGGRSVGQADIGNLVVSKALVFFITATPLRFTPS